MGAQAKERPAISAYRPLRFTTITTLTGDTDTKDMSEC